MPPGCRWWVNGLGKVEIDSPAPVVPTNGAVGVTDSRVDFKSPSTENTSFLGSWYGLKNLHTCLVNPVLKPAVHGYFVVAAIRLAVIMAQFESVIMPGDYPGAGPVPLTVGNGLNMKRHLEHIVTALPEMHHEVIIEGNHVVTGRHGGKTAGIGVAAMRGHSGEPRLVGLSGWRSGMLLRLTAGREYEDD